MSKIFRYNEFVLNEEAVSIPQVIIDFVEFMKESPVVDFYPEDEDGKVREGWITKEHKMYSTPGIIRYFKAKHGDDYSSLNVRNAIHYDPNIKKLTKMLSDNGMTLQMTPMKAMYGETSWFYSVNLSDEERESIKSKYEAEFASRYANHFARRAAARKTATKPAASKRGRKSTKGDIKEALELLIEGLFSIK